MAGGGGHAVTDAAQAGAEAQHQAGTQRGAARLKYNKNLDQKNVMENGKKPLTIDRSILM